MGKLNVSRAIEEASAAESSTEQQHATPQQRQASSQRKTRDPAEKKSSRNSGSGQKRGQTTKGTQKKQGRTAPVSDDTEASPPEEPKPQPPKKHDKRVPVTMSQDMRKALSAARVEDDIEATVRIRAMIELWMSDPRIRSRVDKIAQARSTELISHRWPKEQEKASR